MLINTALMGLGHVNRNLLTILAKKADVLRRDHGIGYRGAVPMESLLAGVDLVFEASPVDLRTGGPGLALTRAALGQGISVVLANKGPVVLAFRELHETAARTGAGHPRPRRCCAMRSISSRRRRESERPPKVGVAVAFYENTKSEA